MTSTISLLHATYRTGSAAIATRDRWLQLADEPELIDHRFAYDLDDEISANEPEIVAGCGSPSMGGRVSAVRNWNVAAAGAQGDLLAVIADDLVPAAAGWDTALRALICDLDPRRVPFVIKVDDGARADEHLLRHPVISMAFYERFGLFHHGYFGIGADNDFTWFAHSCGLVIDGRCLKWLHSHPGRGAAPSPSHRKMTGEEEVRYGKTLLADRWPPWRRRVLMRYFRPRPGQSTVPRTTVIARQAFGRIGWVGAVVPPSLRRSIRRLMVRSPSRPFR